MPTYDYQCSACNHEFELFQSMKDNPKRKCPKCGKNALERLIGTGAAVLFKGSGFYETDYRSKSYADAAKADKPDAGTTPTADTKSAEAKPEQTKQNANPEKSAKRAKPDRTNPSTASKASAKSNEA